MCKYFAAISVASSVQEEEATEMAAKYLLNKKIYVYICIYIHIYIYIYILQSLQKSLYNRSLTHYYMPCLHFCGYLAGKWI